MNKIEIFVQVDEILKHLEFLQTSYFFMKTLFFIIKKYFLQLLRVINTLKFV